MEDIEEKSNFDESENQTPRKRNFLHLPTLHHMNAVSKKLPKKGANLLM